MNKTIVILSAKRCGSTALYKTLMAHKDVQNCKYSYNNSRNWEPAFWYHAWRTLTENIPGHMRKRYAKSYSYMMIPDVNNQDDIFKLWDAVLKNKGPVVLAKSPQNLINKHAVKMLMDYRDAGNDVRIVGLIRDPRDAITSQYLKWHGDMLRTMKVKDSPERRESLWLEYYQNLEYVKENIKELLILKYEEFANNPKRVVRRLCKYCDLTYSSDLHNHIKPTNIGRYKTATDRKIRGWEKNWTPAFKEHLKKYGYI